MKKLLILFTALSFIAISCSSEDGSSSGDTSVLPQTISFIYPGAYLGRNGTSTLSFNGNKIVSTINEYSKTVFTYTGDVITKQEVFDVDEQGKETKTDEVVYTYENGKLKTRIFKENITDQYPDGYYIEKVVYNHISNESISFINYNVDRDTKAEIKSSEGSLTYKNGNLIKEQRTSNSVTITREYEYDTKNNPLKNVAGFKLLLNEISEVGQNNVVKTTAKSSEHSNTAVYLTTYDYNDKDYPTKHTSYDSWGVSIEYEMYFTY
ncbi:hypothetical protein [Flavobacterium phragmitis]|uniref:YD repeat-containing protein n=1 Tax=Flavobacterium phragmitis TaxID=739143 RepID=A0A1I1PNL7_9FLAO|nr:hypothetical protein [Flavobacterium phragmitis]SFD11411.1 hypothetical protein SAMN05216297_104278 [Flavobacterium phragmitis]